MKVEKQLTQGQLRALEIMGYTEQDFENKVEEYANKWLGMRISAAKTRLIEGVSIQELENLGEKI